MKGTSASLSLYLAFFVTVCSAFVSPPRQHVVSVSTLTVTNHAVMMAAKKEKSHDETATDKKQNHQAAFGMGTFVEFQEKKRTHVGKILHIEFKANGGARYAVEDSEGKKYGIADKQVTYAIPCPTSPGKASKLYQDFCRAQDAPFDSLNAQLEMTPELLQMVWEEKSVEDEAVKDHGAVTPAGLIELVQGHAASSIEKYLAWKLLRTDLGHLFFKEIKESGRVVAFKAKTIKTVDAAKRAFCQSHTDSEICLV